MNGVRPKATIFDLGGVLTSTEHLHAEAWEEILNPFLEAQAAREGSPFKPFDPHSTWYDVELEHERARISISGRDRYGALLDRE